jgi:putative endonuclease
LSEATNYRLEAGVWGERWAERTLKDKGYRILGRRVRVGERDEIDLIARHKDVLVFVEVKTREDEEFGRPVSAVNEKKRHVLSRAAVRYLKQLDTLPPYFRFDVVEVIGRVGDPDPDRRHIENAFTLDPRYRLSY